MLDSSSLHVQAATPNNSRKRGRTPGAGAGRARAASPPAGPSSNSDNGAGAFPIQVPSSDLFVPGSPRPGAKTPRSGGAAKMHPLDLRREAPPHRVFLILFISFLLSVMTI